MINKEKQKRDALTKLIENPELAQKLAREVFQQLEKNPGLTLKDVIGISDETFEEIYTLAYNYYNRGKYRESIPIFEFLAGASPTTFKYVLGLAASYHQIQAYEDAIVGFTFALELDPSNPIPAYYAIDCFLKINRPEEALECAELTSFICDQRPEYAAFKQRADLIAENLKLKK